jgi:hypothetical protein
VLEAVPVWKLKPPDRECAELLVEALAADPTVVELAFDAENTGWRLRACALPFDWLTAAEEAMVVPAPAWAEKVPLATPLEAVAVVAVAAEAIPATDSATAATAAKRAFFM